MRFESLYPLCKRALVPILATVPIFTDAVPTMNHTVRSRRQFLFGSQAVGMPQGGVAVFLPNCLALNAVVCRACAEQCDLDLIRFKPQLGGVSFPTLDAERCTGCADCLAACPTQAIVLEPRPQPSDAEKSAENL